MQLSASLFKLESEGTSMTTRLLMRSSEESPWQEVPYIRRLSLTIDATEPEVISPTIELLNVPLSIELQKVQEAYSQSGGYISVVETQDMTPEMVAERVEEIREKLKREPVIIKVIPRVAPDKTNKGVILEGVDGKLLSFEDIELLYRQIVHNYQYKDMEKEG